MIKYKVKKIINGDVSYKGRKIKQNEFLDEYDVELLKLVEQGLVKVKKTEVDGIKEILKEEKEKEKEKEEKKKKKKKDDEINELDN